MTTEQESSLDSSRFSTRSQEWPQQKNNKKFQQRNKVARMLLFSKRILIFIMIGFTIHSNFSLIGKEGNFNEARGKKRQRSEGFEIAHNGRVITLHSAPSEEFSRHYGAYANIYSNDGSMHIQ